MAVWDAPARLWTVARKVEDLLELQTKTRTALEAVDTRLRTLEDRMTRLEAGREILITEAKAAAGMAATGLAGSVLSEVVTRVTRLEGRQDDIQRRLPPPTAHP
jgi:vacuolar-type H+-ATPase subunit I/STV1